MKLMSLLNRFFRINQGYGDINHLQKDIMLIIIHWVKTKKTPVPRAYVMKEAIKQEKLGRKTIEASLRVLEVKGYIRRAIVVSTKTYYVQLRSVSE